MIIKEEWIKVSNLEDIKDDHEKETVVSRNFIENIIDKDLEDGVYSKIVTRFPPEPNGYLHIGSGKGIWRRFSSSF